MGADGVTSGKEDFQPADHFLLKYDKTGGATIPDHAGYYLDGSKAILLKGGCCRQLLAPCQGPPVLGDLFQHRMGLCPSTGSLHSSYSMITTFLSMFSLELWSLCESERGP